MTNEQLLEIVSIPDIEERIRLLKTKELTLPQWTDLQKSYEAVLHPIMTDFKQYPTKINPDTSVDEFKRIPLAMQEMAVNSIGEAMFIEAVTRRYDFESDDSGDIEFAKEALETNIKVDNLIDATNLQRAKALFRSCQVATVWTLDPTKPTVLKGIPSKALLVHKIYSPDEGYMLYPYFSNNKLIGLSIEFKTKELVERVLTNVEYIHVHLVGSFIIYKKEPNGWIEFLRQPTGVEILLANYIYIETPIWGGQKGDILVEQLEDMLSKQQMYIDKNAVPMYVSYEGENTIKSGAKEKLNDSARHIALGKGGFLDAVQWKGATEAMKGQWDYVYEQFYQMNGLFDNRPSVMQIKSMSAENKEILLFTAKAKAKDLGGIFYPLFLTEFEIIRTLMSIQYPSLKNDLAALSVFSQIKAYSIRSKQETANYVKTSRESGGMSVETAVEVLGEVENVKGEIDNIAMETVSNNNF